MVGCDVDNMVRTLLDVHLPNGFDTTDNADVVNDDAKVLDIFGRTGRILVWTGFSDRTIYSNPTLNYGARAWHDACHISGRYPHDWHGESATLSVQQAQVRQLRLPDADRLCRVLACEVIGQVELYYRLGFFPDDQREFAAWFMGQKGYRA